MNVPAIAGLGEGVRFILSRGVSEIWKHEQVLTRRLLDGLAGIPGVHVHGPRDPGRMVGVVSFTIDGWESSEAASVLHTLFGLMLRAGYHCAPSAHRTIGTADGGTVRAAFGPYSTAEHADRLIDAVRHLRVTRRSTR